MIFWTYSSHKNHRNDKNRLHLHPCKPFSIGRQCFCSKKPGLQHAGEILVATAAERGLNLPYIMDWLTWIHSLLLVQSGRHTGSMRLNPCKSWDETENGRLNWPSTAHPSHIVHFFLRLLDIDFATPVVGMSHLCPSECWCSCFFPQWKCEKKNNYSTKTIHFTKWQKIETATGSLIKQAGEKNWHSLS